VVSVQTPALRTVGNIVTGSDGQTQTMINNSVLPALGNLLHSSKDSIRKEVCWTISNITAGPTNQIQVRVLELPTVHVGRVCPYASRCVGTCRR
jgi:importin subunit alpha-6/7